MPNVMAQATKNNNELVKFCENLLILAASGKQVASVHH
jgi:hypothetical protein